MHCNKLAQASYLCLAPPPSAMMRATMIFICSSGHVSLSYTTVPYHASVKSHVRPGARLCGARGGGAQDHQLVGECARGGADHGGLGEDDGGGDGGSVVAVERPRRRA